MTTRTVIIVLGLTALVSFFTSCSQTPNSADLKAVNNPGNNPGPNPTPTPIPGCPAPPCTSAPTPQTYFTSTVKPLLESPRCNTCHALPFQGGTAPLTIFDYAPAKRLLGGGGTSSVNNNFINRPQGLNGHTNNCSAGLLATPCKEIMAWWEAEYGRDTSGRFVGQLEYVSSTGNISGWAVDVDNINSAVQVRVYADGAAGTGTLLTTLSANQSGSPTTYPGNHAFVYDLPAAYRNAQPHDLYIYIVSGAQNFVLQGTPIRYTAYTPRAAGMQYFQQTVAPLLQSNCGSCHGVDYMYFYYSLLNLPPHLGGTATDNLLINKPSATVTHGGGNRCGNKNSAPCLQIQEWWRREFL